MKTAELTGAALDWAVAKCEGADAETLDPITWIHTAYPSGVYNYSTNWSQGGPIIEREFISVEATGIHPYWHARMAYESEDGIEQWSEERGPTPLIAAMRCYVASKLGDDITIPEELL